MLEARAVTKRYGALLANDRVDLCVAPGEVVALVGENGAGKSTLVRLLSGCARPDAGTLAVDGRTVTFRSPRHAAALGVGTVHQHFSLVPTLTVLDNLWLALGGPRRAVAARAAAAMEQTGLRVPLDEPVGRLPVPLQQRAELLRALARECRYLLLDEPTAALGPADAESVRRLARTLASLGKGVLVVTHRIADVEGCAHRVVVLRRGRPVGEWAVSTENLAAVCAEMVGELPPAAENADFSGSCGAPVLALDGVGCSGDRESRGLEDVTLTVHAGEILGIGGVNGNGQEALAEVAAGLRRPATGRVTLDGRDVSSLSPSQRQKLGLAHVPADRRRHGAVAGAPVYRNLCLRRYREHFLSPGGWVKPRNWRAFARRLRDGAAAGWRLEGETRHLSGGNLQRLILARELDAGPTLLVAVYPTRGLDAASTARIRAQLLERRRAGGGVLLISEDLDELLALCDRVAVLGAGRVVGTLTRCEATPEKLGRLLAGGWEGGA